MIHFIIYFFVVALAFKGYGDGPIEKDLENAQNKKILNQKSISIPSTSLRSKSFEAFWKSNFNISAFNDRSAEDVILSTQIYTKVNWNLLHNFSIHAEGLVIGRNGFTQSIYDRPDRRNGFHFIEGFFHWKALDYLDIKFGNIKQSFLEAPLLITDKTFPSIIETFHFKPFESFKIAFAFQQAIPSNATEFVKRETQIIEPPHFLTGSVFAEYKNYVFSLKNKLTGFYFSELPSAVADQGRIYGNTIDFIESDSRFKYDFAGIYNKLVLQILFSGQWIGEIGGDFIRNLKAPDTYNQGEKIYISSYHDFYNLMEIKITGEVFANQSDSSVSYYNSEVYGHNNRVGWGANIQSYFYNSGLRVKLGYIHNNPINTERSASGTSDSIIFLIGTNYVSI